MMLITLNEAKSHLRVDHNADDHLITQYIIAASELIKKYCTKDIINENNEVHERVKIATMFYVSILFDENIDIEDEHVMPKIIRSLLYDLRSYTII